MFLVFHTTHSLCSLHRFRHTFMSLVYRTIYRLFDPPVSSIPPLRSLFLVRHPCLWLQVLICPLIQRPYCIIFNGTRVKPLCSADFSSLNSE